MPTLQDCFELDFDHGDKFSGEWLVPNRAGALMGKVYARVHQDFLANSKYLSFFIGKDESPYAVSLAESIFDLPATTSCILSKDLDRTFKSFRGRSDYSDRASSDALVFTKRIHFYIDALLASSTRQRIIDLGAKAGFHVLLRDHEYLAMRSPDKPLAFISYDFADGPALARPLASALSSLRCPVWFSEFSLQAGDNLREHIERGIREAPKCVLILSPHFLDNRGWAKAEFDSVYVREMIEKEQVIVPVWHGVGHREVYAYSPRLAGVFALMSSIGVPQLAWELSKVIKGQTRRHVSPFT